MSNPYQHKATPPTKPLASTYPSGSTFSPYYSSVKPTSSTSSSSMNNPYESTIPNPYDSPIPNPYDTPIPNPYDVAASTTATSAHAAESQAAKPKLTKFNVSGTIISFPTEVLTSKVPYSKLADIAAGYLTTVDAEEEGVWIDANIDAFKVLLEYLRYDTLYIPSTLPKAIIKRVFRDMGVDWPGGIGQISTTPPPAPEEEHYPPEVLAALKEIRKDLVSVDRSRHVPSDSQALLQFQEASSHAVATSPQSNLPSYDESSFYSSSSNPFNVKKPQTPSQALDQLGTSFRSVVTSSLDTQITDLLLSHITPQLQAQAKMGILRGSVVVIPPSKPSQQPSFSYSAYSLAREREEEDEEIVSSVTSALGDNASGWCKVLRLPNGIGVGGVSSDRHGNVTMAFISQPEAIKEIRKRLIRALNTGPGGVYDDTDELLDELYEYKKTETTALGAAEYPPRLVFSPPGTLVTEKGSLLVENLEPTGLQDDTRRQVGGYYPSADGNSKSYTSSSSSKWWKWGASGNKSSTLRPQNPLQQQALAGGGQTAVQTVIQRPKKPEPKKGSVLVDVILEDIHVRKMSDLGLYETKTLKGVIVRIEVVA